MLRPLAEIQASIDKGVAWIAKHRNAGGYWGTGNYVGVTGFNVLKLEEYAWEQGIDPLSPNYIYNEPVKIGLAYLFSRVQTSGTHQGSIYYSTQCYETGIAIMAISASRHPEMDSGVSDGAGGTLTYKQVVEKAMDYSVPRAGPERDLGRRVAVLARVHECGQLGLRLGDTRADLREEPLQCARAREHPDETGQVD